MKGFGLMVTDKGVRSYLVQYRIGGRGAPTRRVTIGKHGSPWTPSSARERAAELLEMVRRKIDPFDAEREALEATRSASAAKAKAEAELSVLVFNTVADGYVAAAKKSLRRAGEQERIIERDLRPVFGSMLLTAITADDINDQLAAIAERTPSAALKAYVAMRGVYAYAHERHRRLFPKSLSPFDSVQRPQGGKTRDRYLTDAELRVMHNVSLSLGWPFGPIYSLLLLTGLRLREVAEAGWSEIDFAEKRWNVPAERMKNGLPHWVHLSPQAITILKSLPKVYDATKGKDFIFTTNSGQSPVSGFSKAKTRLNTAMLKLMKEEAVEAKDDPDAVKLAPFVIHDTRRSIARGCQRLGIAPEVTERMLSHIAEVDRGLKGTYQVYKHEPERIAATNRWARELDRIASGGTAKVITMRKKA